MGILRTIVATAVIVFALTTVAMAGVQHLTKSGQAAPQTAHPNYTVTLTDKQLAKLLTAGQKQSATHTATHEQRQAQTHVQDAEHTYATAHTDTHNASQQSSGSAGPGGGSRCYDASHGSDSGHGSGSCDSHSGEGNCD